MTLHHSAMPPDDLAERRSVRFRLRGDHGLVECFVSWDALDRLEDRPAANTAERLARFEQHRARIEAAALARQAKAGGGEVRLDADDLMRAGNV